MENCDRVPNAGFLTISRKATVRWWVVSSATRSQSAEHHAQIVCRHFGDNRSRESNRLRHRGDRFEASQAPARVAIAKAPVERLVARGRCEPFAYVRTIEIERRRRREYRGRPLISPSVASHGEMWTMLMQMIPSADAIGQSECDVSRAMGARTFVTPVAFTQAATLSRASGSGSEGWKTRAGKCLAKWTICSPEPLAISRMRPVVGRTSRRTSRMKSRLRSVAGACWRSSLIFLTHFQEVRPWNMEEESSPADK